MVEGSLGMELELSNMHPGPAEEATYCGSIYISKQVAQGWSYAAPDIDLHQTPSQINTPSGSLQTISEHDPISSVSSTLKGRFW